MEGKARALTDTGSMPGLGLSSRWFAIARALGLGECQWRRAAADAQESLAALAGHSARPRTAVEEILSDRPRSGIQDDCSAEQICQIIEMACQTCRLLMIHSARETLVR